MANMRIPFTIKPDTDLGASHYAKFGIGGYYSVKDISERNSIPDLRLEPGLIVYVKDTHETWQYLGGTDGWSKILIPNLSEWTDLSERIVTLENEKVWVEESADDTAAEYLSEFAGESIYTASEIDEMLAKKAEVVENYFIVAPSCVHYGVQSIKVLVYQRNAEFGTYLITQDNLSPVGLQISYKIYDRFDVLQNTISVNIIEDGGFSISAGNIPESGRIVITLGVHSSRDYSVIDIYDSHEICVVTDGKPLTFKDLTKEQIRELQLPATLAVEGIQDDFGEIRTEIAKKQDAITGDNPISADYVTGSVKSESIRNIEAVSELPETPDENTLYIVL